MKISPHLVLEGSEVTQSCLTFCDPMDYSPPDSSVYGVFQARILEWVAISFPRQSSRPRDRTWVSSTPGSLLALWATREDQACSLLGCAGSSLCMHTRICGMWDLVPWPGIDPGPLPAAWNLSHWTTREAPKVKPSRCGSGGVRSHTIKMTGA